MPTTSERVHLVSASAGSGKTFRLTEILTERILSGEVRPEALVATTFTTKAAAELQERVRERLLEAGCHDEALRLGAARIGTVNSVCSRLVSDFALDLGLSPDLRVLDDAAAKRALRKALTQVLTGEDWRLLEALGDRMASFLWAECVDKVVRLARDNGLGPADLRACGQRSLETFLPLLPDPVADGAALEHALLGALNDFARRVDTATDGTKVTAEYLERVRKCLQRLRQDRGLPWGEWSYLAGQAPGSKSKALAVPIQQAAREHVHHPRLRQDLEDCTRLVFDLAARGLEAYAESKRATGVLDFSDQEVLTRKLLSMPSVRDLLRAELDLVLVDEFQDTSPQQLAIFLDLASLAKKSVWVGDQKQAIYGFRGTDPALMDAALAALGGDFETLGKSWRSRPPLVRLTSSLFEQAFAPLMPPERVALEPAVPEPAGAGPGLEWWPLDRKGSHGHLAATVKAFLEDEAVRVRDPRSGELRRPTRADVAVLCFRRKTCQAVARELELRGVPAVLPRERLLSTPEGLLVLAGLRLWADPRDTLAKAELARLTDYAEQPDGWLQRLLEARWAAFESLPAVAMVLESRKRLLHAGPVTATEAVMEAVGAREWCLAWGHSERRLANLEALRALAFTYVEECLAEGRGCTVAGLVAFLGEVRALGQDEQATGVAEDAVHVLTWHGAKGLEWPVTVLYELDRRERGSALGVHVVSDREEFDLAHPLAGRWVRYWPSPYHANSSKSELHQRLEDHPATQVAREAEQRETLRLLYVGWTRARDVLVLAGQPKVFEKRPLCLVADSAGVPLLSEPSGASVCWAGEVVPVKVREEEGDRLERMPSTPGAAPLLAGPRAHPEASLLPSRLEAVVATGRIAEQAILGPRIPLRGTPDMQAVGEAVHTFLAVDRAELPHGERVGLARECLANWGVPQVVQAEELVAAATALHRWVEGRWPGAVWHRELPLAHRLASGTLVQGTADLVLEAPGGLVLVDHKTFPGNLEQARERALGHAAQLDAYARACSAATGLPVLERWIHLPLSGLALMVSPPSPG